MRDKGGHKMFNFSVTLFMNVSFAIFYTLLTKVLRIARKSRICLAMQQ